MVDKLLKHNRHGQQPKWSDMGVHIANHPLHQKDVLTILRYEVDLLPVEDQELLARWARVKRWLTDAPVGVERGRAVEARMTDDEIKIMIAVGHAELIDEDKVRSTVNVFPVGENFKKRRRLIKHTKAFNEAFGKEYLEGLGMLKTQDLVPSVHDGKFAICMDFSGWFDQIEQDDVVKDFMCFPHRGKWYRLTRVAMGMRTSVDIAHTITQIIASFPMPGVRCDVYVDNIRFLSDNLEAVVAAAKEFIIRCRKVRATINEVPDNMEDPEAAARRLVTSAGEFLGARFDYIAKTVQLTEKTIAKLTAMRDVFTDSTGHPTYRNFLALFGLLFYGLQVFRSFAPYRYYALKEYSDVARRIQRDPGLLESHYKCPPARMQHILAWVNDLLLNPETAVRRTRDPSDVDYILVTDASKKGWGGVLLDQRTGAVYTQHGTWDHQWKGREHSAWSEPEGLARAFVAFFPNGTTASFTVLTDSSTAKGAFEKGRSMKFAVNRALQSVSDVFSNGPDATYHHIPGIMNTDADLLSRYGAMSSEDLHGAADRVHRLVLGISPAGAFHNDIHVNQDTKVSGTICGVDTCNDRSQSPNAKVMKGHERWGV